MTPHPSSAARLQPPAARAATASATPALAPLSSSTVAPVPTRLLIVDGSRLPHTAELQAGAAAGLQCTTVDRIEAALELLEKERPTLVLLDGATAWSQGPEAFARLKHPKYGDLPVVLVADSSSPAELIEECWKWGIDDCLLRPVRAADLRARCEAVAGAGGPPDARSERHARRILLVDGEDPGYAERLGRLLELNGYRLLRTRAGAHAADLATAQEQGALDLLLLLTQSAATERRGLTQQDPRVAALPALVVAGAASPAERAGVPNLAGWLERAATPPEAVVQRVNALFEASTRNLQADQRVPFFCPVEFRVWGDPQAVWTSAFSFNVSAGGIFVRTLVPARPRAAVELRIHLTTTREELPATGVVAWANRFATRRVFSYPVGMGVQFLGMPLSKRLAHLIEICRSTSTL